MAKWVGLVLIVSCPYKLLHVVFSLVTIYQKNMFFLFLHIQSKKSIFYILAYFPRQNLNNNNKKQHPKFSQFHPDGPTVPAVIHH